MNPLPLLLAPAILSCPAFARQPNTVSETATPDKCMQFALDHMRAATGNTEAMLQLSMAYDEGTVVPRDPNLSLYYALKASMHDTSGEAASIADEQLQNTLTDIYYQQACPQWTRTSPGGTISVRMQRKYPENPGILKITISETDDATDTENENSILRSFPLSVGDSTTIPTLEFQGDTLTIQTLSSRYTIPCTTEETSQEEDDDNAEDRDLALRAQNGDTVAMRILSRYSEARNDQIAWLQKAADLGNVKAMLELGDLYGNESPDHMMSEKTIQLYARATAHLMALDQAATDGNSQSENTIPPFAAASHAMSDDRWHNLAGEGITGSAGLGIVKFRHQGKTFYGIGELPSGPEPTIGCFLCHLYDNPEQLAADVDKWSMAFNIFLYGENMDTWKETEQDVHRVPWTWQEQRNFHIGGSATENIRQIILEQWNSIDSKRPDFLAPLRKEAERQEKTLADICNLNRPEYEYDPDSARILAEQGNPDAMYALGKLYFSGTLPSNTITPQFMPGIAWMEKAAAKGHPGACGALGLLYAEGLGVRKNIATARQYLQRARGIPAAERLLQSLPNPRPDAPAS